MNFSPGWNCFFEPSLSSSSMVPVVTMMRVGSPAMCQSLSYLWGEVRYLKFTASCCSDIDMPPRAVRGNDFFANTLWWFSSTVMVVTSERWSGMK